MTQLKILVSSMILLLLFACGGTKEDETDYTQITDVELFEMASKDLENGKYQRALDNFNRILLDFPISNLHIDSQLKIAEVYGKMDNFEEQMMQLHRLVKENIIPERVPKIYVQIGKFYERAALFNPGIITSDSIDYKRAIEYYENAFKYPDSDDNKTKSEAVYRRGLVEAKIGQINNAVKRYELVKSLFPNSDYSILAQIKLKDPANVSELTTTDSAMTVYRQTLGLVEALVSDEDEDEVVSEEVSDDTQVEGNEGNLNETFKYQEDAEGTTDESINDDGTVDDAVDESTEIPAEDTLTPAESDTSGL